LPQVKSEVREYAESFAIAIVLALFIIFFVAQSFLVQGSSMEPSLHDGQRLLVDKVTYRFREPRRGEVVVFGYPKDPRRKFIKRIVGLPGDVVEIRNRQLVINNEPIAEDYIRGPMYQPFGPYTVPEGTVWVLGDNRNNSEDSRFADVGPVPMERVVGRALFVYWPPATSGIIAAPEALAELER